jgi:hypothetical protein
MTTQKAEAAFARLVVPLPPPEEKPDPYTKDQWATLMAFADTVIPSIKVSEQPSDKNTLYITTRQYADLENDVRSVVTQGYPEDDVVKAFFAEPASAVALPLFKRVVGDLLHQDTRNKIGLLLTLLGYV